MIEIPPKFAGRAPVGPEIAVNKGTKKQATRDAFEEWTVQKDWQKMYVVMGHGCVKRHKNALDIYTQK